MGKKPRGSRSGNTKRQIAMAFELVKMGKSYQEASKGGVLVVGNLLRGVKDANRD
jgi:hypothetical protein